jgi:lipopolysaccharide transport system permease protein
MTRKQRLDLLLNLVHAELTARYKTTALGVLWFVLNPLFTMLILVIVFGRLIRLDIDNYPIFVLSALLPWTFFQMGVVHAASSVTRSAGLVKRVRIPRVFIPLSAVLASLVHFLISLAVLFAFMAVLGTPFTRYLLWLPAVIALELVFLTGAALLVASLGVVYRDVEYALEPTMRALFYLTPSFYPLSYVPPAWLSWYLINPMAGIVEIFRQTLTAGALPPVRVLAITGATSLATMALGIVVFRRAEPYFDDYV